MGGGRHQDGADEKHNDIGLKSPLATNLLSDYLESEPVLAIIAVEMMSDPYSRSK
jgi:hypothetical protein